MEPYTHPLVIEQDSQLLYDDWAMLLVLWLASIVMAAVGGYYAGVYL